MRFTRGALFCILGAIFASNAFAQNIHTAAGGALPNGVAATSASVDLPYGLSVSSTGNLIVACSGQNTICQISSGQMLTIVAGNGGGGYAGDGSAALSGELNYPTATALDAAGDIFVADTSNNAVRRIDAETGAFTTVAGTGVSGYTGDSGAATSAELDSPFGVAVDSSGNLYIADTANNVIRRVSAGSGLISTVAGTGAAGYTGDGSLATAAQLSSPSGVAVDSAGNLFIADSLNNVVRRVDAQTRLISTVAGNGTAGYSGDGTSAIAAQLDFPSSLAMDGTGDLYIADYSNNAIRRVDAQTGIITTVAGNGLTGYSGDGAAAVQAELNAPAGVALDASGNLFVADTWNSRIRRVDAQSGIITTVGGDGLANLSGDGGPAASAGLSFPSGVALDASDNVLIADLDDNSVREVNFATGLISTIAGTGAAGYTGDGAAAASAQLNSPTGVVEDTAGNIYIADSGNNVVREIAGVTGIISTIAGTGTVGYSGDGGPATSAQLNFPTSVAVDAAGDVFIADYGNQAVREISAQSGTISTVAGNGTPGYAGDGAAATTAELNYPSSISLDALGDIYIADYLNNRVRMVSAQTGVITTVAGTGTPGYSGDAGAATGAELNLPTGVFVDATGAVFISDSANNLVRRVDGVTGDISTVAGNGTAGYNGDAIAATSAELSFPMGIALDVTGKMWVADLSNNRVRQVDAPAAVQLTPASLTFPDQTLATTSDPQTVALQNTGGSPLGITSIAASTGYAESDNCPVLPQTLAAGGSCQINVTFTPPADGTQSGSLSIADSAYSSPQAVSLTGTGTAADAGDSVVNLAVAPGSSGTASIDSGGSTTFALIASSTTTQPLTSQWQNVSGSGSVTLACSGLPSGASCDISPESFSLLNASTRVTVKVNTTAAPPAAAAERRINFPNAALGSSLCLVMAILLGISVSFGRAAVRPLQSYARPAAFAAILAMMPLLLGACGYAGHPSTAAPAQSATPPGTYSIAVKATTAKAASTVELTLVVK